MLKKGILSAILLFILISICRGNKEDIAENKSILILFSMQPTTPAYRSILEGIRTKLTNEFGDHYNLHIEYLETNRYPKGAYPREKFEPFNEKYRDVKLHLLICVGIDIVSTLKSFAEPYLLNLPTVSTDYDFSDYGIHWDISLNDETVAIPLNNNLEKSLSTILGLFPGADSIYFICGNSFIDGIQTTASKQEVTKLNDKEKCIFIENLSMDEVLRKVRHLPENIIIIVPSFNTDIKRVPYYNPESVRLISKAANAPVFTYSDMGFGDGAVGGYLVNFAKVGMITGDAAVKILKGADPASIKYSEDDYYEYMFDWRELKRWNLTDSKRIPKGSSIQFEEITFFGKYKWIMTAGLLFLFLQTLLIARLVLLNRKQRRMALQIKETENKYRELVREDRILQIAQLTASLSHELNQPLTAILSNAQAGIRFVNSGKNTPELMNEIFQNIVEDDKRTASILSSVRGMMKLEKREKELLNMNSLVEEVVSIFDSEVRSHKAQLNIQLPEEPVYIYADGTQIQQVILNFVVNAIQSIESGNTENKLINITQSVDKETVTLSVRDFGEGISDSVKDKLFKPFITSKKDGLGIGLSISQSIIHDHEGKIWADNKQDGGAEFSFSLKIQKV